MRYIDSNEMGRGLHDWLDSRHHFSFAEYYNPDNMNFGVLRVFNDDLVKPGTGFETHPHRDMEIISYVVDGELTHRDSMGNEHTLTRGQVQYMSAGTGVLHSEFNLGSELLRFLQIWILPDGRGFEPNYGDHRFDWDERVGRWLPVAAHVNADKSASGLGEAGKAPIRIHADVNMYATFIPEGGSIDFEAGEGRQAYLVLIEGAADVYSTVGSVAGLGIMMKQRDAMEITEEGISICAMDDSHLIAIEMKKA
jgi:redox-sensitive bicupin YhaK (pirin superfamily)